MSARITSISEAEKQRAFAAAKAKSETAEKTKKGRTTKMDVLFVNRAASLVVSFVRLWNGAITLSWMIWLARKTAAYYPLGKSFLIAHSGLFVGKKTRMARKSACDSCPYKYSLMGMEWCRGDNGGRGCGCGHWRPANLAHKIRLGAFRCPQGRFGYGPAVERLIRCFRRLFRRKSNG